MWNSNFNKRFGSSARYSSSNEKYLNEESRSTLNNECYELWKNDRLTKASELSRSMISDNLQKIFVDVFPHAALYQIGSSVNGFGHCHSDFDICLMLSTETFTDFESSFILRKISDVFRQSDFFQNVRLTQHHCPVLHFVDSLTLIDCHLYINQSPLIRSTFLMRFYAECDHRITLLVHTMGWTSSAIVPRFTEMFSHQEFHQNIDVRDLSLSKAIEVAERWSSTNTSTDVVDLFIGFLKFYAIDFDFLNDVISVQRGRKMKKNELPNSIDRNNRYVVIEDPSTGTNIASGINSEKAFQDFLQIFRTNYHKILTSYQLI